MLQSGAFGNLEIPEKMELVIFFLKETLGHLSIESDGNPKLLKGNESAFKSSIFHYYLDSMKGMLC